MLINPRNIQAVARKEFYHIVRDYRSLYMAFALPLLLILLFGYALSLDVDNVKVVIVDHGPHGALPGFRRTPRRLGLL